MENKKPGRTNKSSPSDISIDFTSSMHPEETQGNNTSKLKSNTAAGTPKPRRAQKVNWTPTTEKETYRTVVVNYHFGKRHAEEKHPTRSTGAVSKKRNAWSKMLAAVSSRGTEDDDDDVPNLSKLYENSKEDLTAAVATEKTVAIGLKEDLSKANTPHTETNTETIKVEMFCLPTQQKATVEEPELKTIVESEIEPVSAVIEDIAEKTKKTATVTEAEEVKPPQPFVLYPDVIVISDNEDDSDVENKSSQVKVTEDVPLACSVKKRTKPAIGAECHVTSQQSTSKAKSSGQAKETALHGAKAVSRESSAQQLKLKTQPTNGFKQRQLELHRYRIAVEQRRLELLEVKLARERDEMLREQVLFEKDLELKTSQLKQLQEDKPIDIL